MPVMTCDVMGGLGNQLFQIAATETLAQRHGFTTCYERIQSSPSIFKPRPVYWDSMFSKLDTSEHISTPLIYISESSYEYDSHVEHAVIANKGFNIKFSGYFQSFKYIDAPAIIRRLNPEPKYLSLVDCDNTIWTAIHIRMGDYNQLSDDIYVHLWKTGYYKRAVAYIKEIYPSTKWTHRFVIFSDDAIDRETIEKITGLNPEEFCFLRELGFASDKFSEYLANETLASINFDFANAKFSEYFDNETLPSINLEFATSKFSDVDEMWAMACNFRGIIIANSSFSWWAAYLGQNMYALETIIAPKQWFGAKNPANTRDLIPPDWIML